jgi:hypothetical protein
MVAQARDQAGANCRSFTLHRRGPPQACRTAAEQRVPDRAAPRAFRRIGPGKPDGCEFSALGCGLLVRTAEPAHARLLDEGEVYKSIQRPMILNQSQRRIDLLAAIFPVHNNCTQSKSTFLARPNIGETSHVRPIHGRSCPVLALPADGVRGRPLDWKAGLFQKRSKGQSWAERDRRFAIAVPGDCRQRQRWARKRVRKSFQEPFPGLFWVPLHAITRRGPFVSIE